MLADRTMTKKISSHTLPTNVLIALITLMILTVGFSGCTTTTPPTKQPEQPEATLLTISYGSQVYNYTLSDLTTLSNTSGQGSYINKAGKITGPDTYSGVCVTVLLSTIPTLPANYTFHAVASDGYARNYTSDEVNGHVMVLNRTGAAVGNGSFTMIVAYEKDGVILNASTKGPLRIAFVSDQALLTNSALWVSSLVKIEID